MIVKPVNHPYIPCISPGCSGERKAYFWGRSSVEWGCQKCGNIFRITDKNGSYEVEPTGKKDTQVTVTLRSCTEPPITVKLNTWKGSYFDNDTQEEYEDSQRYFYNEHTCPTNWTREIEMIECDGDKDPHGLFEFVSVEPGWYKDPDYFE